MTEPFPDPTSLETAVAWPEIQRLRGLLARYARHVEMNEGTDFIAEWRITTGDNALTVEDIAELHTIRREAGLS